MKIKADVNTKALASLQAGLSTVASGETARTIMREIAEDFDGRVKRQFETGRDAYGSSWDPPQDGGKPGDRSGNLKGKINVKAAGNRIFLDSGGVDYARFFSRGTSKMTARGIFPTDRLPAAWKEAADRIVRRNVARALRVR